RTAGGVGKDGMSRTHQPNMTQHVLAVFTSDPNSVGPGGIRHIRSEVGQVREVLTPLSRQEVDRIDSFRLGLKQGGGRSEEMHMSVARIPATRVHTTVELEGQRLPTGLRDIGTDWGDVEPSPQLDMCPA